MRRLNIGYDLLTWEGDILRLHFWAHAFEFLKKTGAVFLQTEGQARGLLGDEDRRGRRRGDPDDGVEARPTRRTSRTRPPKRREKVIVRSDGTVTYVGKDMAYQLWKFGLLGKDFYYRVFEGEAPTRPVVDHLRSGGRRPDHPPFGRASWVCNVIDTRQAYLQKLLKQALARARVRGTGRALDPLLLRDGRAVARHGPRARLRPVGTMPSEPFVEVSGRKGLGVKADDLLDRLTDKAAGEVARRNAELSAEESRRHRRERSPSAAVRYFMVKFSRGKVIAFDIDEALSFEGESGPYLQYAVVRANNIFHKLKERDGLDDAGVVTPGGLGFAGRPQRQHGRGPRALGARPRSRAARRSRRPGGADAGAVGAREVRVRPGAGVQRLLPHVSRVLNEERADVRLWRAAAVAYYRAQLTSALDLMGCTVPSKM